MQAKQGHLNTDSRALAFGATQPLLLPERSNRPTRLAKSNRKAKNSREQKAPPHAEGLIGRHSSNRWRLAIALIFSITIVTGTTLSSTGTMGADDWTIGVMLSGHYELSGPCLFINPLLSYTVLTLNDLTSNPNWFLFLERLLVMAGLANLFYITLICHPRYRSAYAFSTVASLVLLLPGCVQNGNFTYVAAFSVIIGAVTFAALASGSISPKHPTLTLLQGCSLMLFGFLLRFDAGLLIAPFVILAITHTLTQLHRNKRDRFAVFVILLALLALILAASAIFNIAIWHENPWKSWDEYNHFRSLLSDFPTSEYSLMSSQLSDIGLSDNDWWLITHWTTADPAVFSTRTLSLAYGASASLDPSTNRLAYALHLIQQPHIVSLSLLCGVLTAVTCISHCCSRTDKAIAAILLLLPIIICSYFWDAGRLPSRIENPVWAAGLIFFSLHVQIARKQKHAEPKTSIARNKLLPLAMNALATLLVCGWSVFPMLQSDTDLSSCLLFEQTHEKEAASKILEYERQNQDRIFWWDASSMESYRQLYASRLMPSEFSLSHNFKLGGWTTNSPQTDYAKSIANVEEGISSLLSNENAYYIATQTCDISDHLLIFLQEHSNPNASKEITDIIDDTSDRYVIYHFSTDIA